METAGPLRARDISAPVCFPRSGCCRGRLRHPGKATGDVWIEDEAGVKILHAAQIADYCPPV
jgi:hypothetical protein